MSDLAKNLQVFLMKCWIVLDILEMNTLRLEGKIPQNARNSQAYTTWDKVLQVSSS